MESTIEPKTRKSLLSYDELIHKMRSKGIQFNITNTATAREVLEKNTYYFKLGSFRKNYKQDSNGHYIKLEFAYLADVATLDTKLRYILLKMCLDLEHAIKTKIITNVTNDPHEDGYSIIDLFFTKTPSKKDILFEHVSKSSKLYKNYYAETPIWVAFELMNYGMFTRFVEYYYANVQLNKTHFKKANELIKYVKNIRNKAAHSSPIILSIHPNKQKNSYLYNVSKEINLTNNQIKVERIHDILAIFILHQAYCTKDIHTDRINLMTAFLKRYEQNKKYYANNENIKRFFSSLYILVDKYH